MCFTTEESTGKAFDECVKKNANAELEKMKKAGQVEEDATFEIEPYGRCEYVDYPMLEKGIAGSKTSDASARVFKTSAVISYLLASTLLMIACSS